MSPPAGRARFSRLLPTLALLCAALFLFAAAPAQAQRTVPDDPQNVQVTGADAALNLTWQAPASWGSEPALRYELQWRIGSTGTWNELKREHTASSRVEPSHTATSLTFSGRYFLRRVSGTNQYHTVTNGTTYQVQIRAVSAPSSDPTDTLPSHYVTVSGTPPIGHSHGTIPSTPRVSIPSVSGTSVSFDIFCVNPGLAPVTDYLLWAEGPTARGSYSTTAPCR